MQSTGSKGSPSQVMKTMKSNSDSEPDERELDTANVEDMIHNTAIASSWSEGERNEEEEEHYQSEDEKKLVPEHIPSFVPKIRITGKIRICGPTGPSVPHVPSPLVPSPDHPAPPPPPLSPPLAPPTDPSASAVHHVYKKHYVRFDGVCVCVCVCGICKVRSGARTLERALPVAMRRVPTHLPQMRTKSQSTSRSVVGIFEVCFWPPIV